MTRRRPVYALLVVLVIATGLVVRRFSMSLGLFGEYAPDALWALMVFLLLGVIFPRASTAHLGFASLTVASLDEISQLYHAPWIDALRETRLGGLMLGQGFLWSDLACYTLGVLAGALVDRAASRRTFTISKNP